MINRPIMSRKDIFDIIVADDIAVSLRHEPKIQRRFVVQIIPS
jgi:hypothetical protein